MQHSEQKRAILPTEKNRLWIFYFVIFSGTGGEKSERERKIVA
jgi:hypothetical protein